MNHAMSDIHALSGAYALDALDDVERAQFADHLATCAQCEAEVRTFRETAAHVAEIETEAPPSRLKDKVLADIATVRPFPPETSVAAPAPIGTVLTLRRRTLPALVAAVVALILLAAGGAAIWHPWTHSRVSVAEQIVHAPDAVRITERVPGGTLTLVRSASLKRAVMIGDHVPEPAPGKTYQLWLQQPGQGMVSAGLMPDSTEPTVLTGNAATAKAAAITVEPETGSSHPTSTPIALFPLRSST
jgi:anti-sigma factor RsiW